MFEVVISVRAESDIKRNAKWWANNHSVDESERWYVGILSAIATLSRMPQRCLVVRNSDQLGRKIHQLLYGVSSRPTHRIYFGIEEEQVIIFRVLGIAQRLPTRSSELG